MSATGSSPRTTAAGDKIILTANHCSIVPQPRHSVHLQRADQELDSNLILLCRFHHLAIHEDIAAVTAVRTGRQTSFTFSYPDGSPLPDDPTERRRTLRSVHEHEQLQIPRRLDAVTDRDWSWTDQETMRIRPLWRGEPFDLGYIVATLFTRLSPNAA